MKSHPPILVVQNVFSKELCEKAIAGFEKAPREFGGIAVSDGRGGSRVALNLDKKRRNDWFIDDHELVGEIRIAMAYNLYPKVAEAFMFQVASADRHLIGRYDAGGRFYAHRDNGGSGTDYRQFAVSIALDDGYRGGGLSFPDYGETIIRVPVGAAVVFSCGLLHEVVPIKAGKRTVYIPFLLNHAGVSRMMATIGNRST